MQVYWHTIDNPGKKNNSSSQTKALASPESRTVLDESGKCQKLIQDTNSSQWFVQYERNIGNPDTNFSKLICITHV